MQQCNNSHFFHLCLPFAKNPATEKFRPSTDIIKSTEFHKPVDFT